MVCARDRGELGVGRRRRDVAVDIDDNRRPAAFERDVYFVPDPFGSQRRRSANDDHLGAFCHLPTGLAAKVDSGDVFGLVQEHFEAGKLQPRFQLARIIQAVAVGIGKEKVVSENKIHRSPQQAVPA
jgi:hypothetical protein